VFEAPLHVGRPNIGNRQRLFERFNEVLDRRWLTNYGPLVQEFEQRVAELVGVKHCIAMCNATVALEITIRALELTGEVIVPSLTFIATAHALQWQQITPVFCDVDEETLCIDPRAVEALITPRTTGIMGVHVFGRPCDVEALQEIATRRRLKLLFDSAHAFACSQGSRMIGGFGQAEVFSFHATKFLNSGEGGAVVTDDDALAAKIRLMENFGFVGYDAVAYIGTNGKMTEFSAAMGLTSLESLDEIVARNRANYDAYRRALAGLPGIDVLVYDERNRSNYQYLVLRVDAARAGLGRDELIKILHAENVLARRYFYPGCHKGEPYRSYFPHAGLLLPVTERVNDTLMQLPTGSAVGTDEIDTIAGLLRTCVRNGAAIRRRMLAQA
jgi:dTDP-4-amino-4,6-dideoxygalactose transaminase